MNYQEWLDFGQKNSWVGPAVCYTHDGLPTSEEEDLESDNSGEYSCIHILRLYESPEVQKAVEENHSPSVWRKLG
jgi:hypothetical protein